MNKDLFFKKMQPYFEQGLIREVYSSENLCILSFGELWYIACPYILINDNPIGVYAPNEHLEKYAKNNALIYPVINKTFGDTLKYKDVIYDFPNKKIDIWKNIIADKKSKVSSDIDYNLEEEIKNISKGKSK